MDLLVTTGLVLTILQRAFVRTFTLLYGTLDFPTLLEKFAQKVENFEVL